MVLSSACHAACSARPFRVVRLCPATNNLYVFLTQCTHEQRCKAPICTLQACKHCLADGSVALQETRRRCQATSPSTCSCRTPTSSATTAGTASPPTPWPCSTALTVALTCPVRAGTGSRPGLPGSRPGPFPPAATAGRTSPPQHRYSILSCLSKGPTLTPGSHEHASGLWHIRGSKLCPSLPAAHSWMHTSTAALVQPCPLFGM